MGGREGMVRGVGVKGGMWVGHKQPYTDHYRFTHLCAPSFYFVVFVKEYIPLKIETGVISGISCPAWQSAAQQSGLNTHNLLG